MSWCYHLLLIEKELRCGWPTRSDNQTLCIVGLEICFQSMLIFKYGCFQYSGNFVQTKYRCQTEDPTQKVLRCHLLFLTLSASLCKPVYLGKWRTQSSLSFATKHTYFSCNAPLYGFNMCISKKKRLVRCKVIEKQWKPCEISIYLNTPLKNKLSKLLHKLLTDATARCACSNKVEYPLEENHLISAVNYHASCPLSASDWQDRSS